MQKKLRRLLFRLLSQPTAPFRERSVIALATEVLGEASVPFFSDPAGNLVIGASSKTDMLRLLRELSRDPVRVFIAHMDHPGFHGVRWLALNVLRVRWHGGSPTKHLQGSRVWLVNDDGFMSVGIMRNARLHKHGRAIDTAEVHLQQPLPSPRPLAKSLYGGFDFRKPAWKSGSRLYTRAADDLVGVFCILATALDVFGKCRTASRPPFLGLLTRAEEVGFVGVLAHFELGWLQQARRPLACVSLEASRTLPGALIGKGPIVRLGDRRTPFDAAYSQVLTQLADDVLPGQYQRRIMDGGSCEGSAATAYGLSAIAMAVPLGNYHNQGLEGGVDCRGRHGPAPEFVHLGDIEGQLKLCLALMRKGLPWQDPWQDVRKKLRENLDTYRGLL